MKLQLAVSLLLLGSLSTGYAAEKRLFRANFAPSQRSFSAEQTAREFLAVRGKGLGIDTQSLQLVRTQSSLLANHLSFQQTIGDVPVSDALIIVSVSKKDGKVFQFYNTALESLYAPQSKSRISLDQAYDAAWAYVGVQDKLFEEPKAKLQYIQGEKGLRLVYSIELSPTKPYGAFGIDVDAQNGDVVGVRDLRITEKAIPLPKTFGTKQPTIPRLPAFHAIQNKAQVSVFARAGEVRSGNAKVFDPDPKTFLNTDNLKDSSKAADFDAAYVDRILPDLSFVGDTYSLSGPWVKIIDFDPPTAKPTTSKDGNWNFKRGQGGFNDAMTYFHLDQSQRYIQSLGFKDDNGIQFGPIEVDADGVNGDDNSYFQSSSNRLSFGHGCVDDNEDADVILHEYGHAINYSINHSWSGGDTGAMGEGFGDYWAASYSYSTENGKIFQPDKVYNWDAGTCWAGRVLNAVEARYDPAKSYYAHSSISGGFQSDELWSTPLFQSHRALRELGVPREEIDTIILESQFGLGGGLKMRELAQSIVATAERLYPEGPHAEVFRDHFVDQGILVIPRPILTASLGKVIDDDGALDPGEAAIFPLTLKNTGDKIAENLSVEVTSTDEYVEDLVGSFSPGNLAAGKETTVNVNLTVAGNAPCGHTIKLSVVIKDKDGKTWTVPVEALVGRALRTAVAKDVNTAIPDKDSSGITSILDVASDAQVSSSFLVSVDVKHTYRGDLRLILTAPSGRSVILHDRSGGSEDNIVGTYPTTLTPKESLSNLIGEELNGEWKLKVSDEASSDKGSLVSWGIEDISGYECR